MDHVVLITGASRGIGKSCAYKFAQNKYNVVINYCNSKNEAQSLSLELEKLYNIKTLVIKCDVSKEEEVSNMINEIIKKFGHIDVLVNNAGISIDTTFEDKKVDNFRRILDVNLIGTFLVSKYVGEFMLKNKHGSIINITSTNAIDTYYKEGLDYDASKAGVISLTHNLANAYAPFIRVNAIASGWVNTEMNKDLDLELKKTEEKKILLERFAEPNEIANIVYFLASKEASYINSSIIRVDGGKRV